MLSEMFGGKVSFIYLVGVTVMGVAVATTHLQLEESEPGVWPDVHLTRSRSHREVGSGEGAVKSVRNITKFPVCINDEDCGKISSQKGEDYRCFQYMCYPWNNSREERPFRSCQKNRDCLNLPEANGGDGNNGKCYRHFDRRKIQKGICLKESEAMECEDDKGCPSPLKCIINHCGDPVYHQALTMLPCQTSELCQDLRLGSECCIDFSGSIGGWKTSQAQWEKRCCEPPVGGSPLIRPPSNITKQQIKKIDATVKHMVNFGLDEMVCNGFEYEMMEKMENCFPYTTTTTTTPKPTTRKPTTKKPAVNAKQKTNGTTHLATRPNIQGSIAGIFLFLALHKRAFV